MYDPTEQAQFLPIYCPSSVHNLTVQSADPVTRAFQSSTSSMLHATKQRQRADTNHYSVAMY